MSTEPQPIDGLPSYAELRTRTDAPAGSNWFLFGRDDQIGTLNLLRHNSLCEAAGEVRDGTAFHLDLPSDALTSSLAPTRKPAEHRIFSRTPYHHDEWLDGFYTQYGSQLDGLRHIAHPDHGFYNNADPRRFTTDDGLLGMANLAAVPIAGRAVLLDIGRYLEGTGAPLDHLSGPAVGVEVVEATEVTPELVEAFERLTPQLSSSNPPPTQAELAASSDVQLQAAFAALEGDGAASTQ